MPDHHDMAVVKNCHVGVDLAATGVGVDLEFAAHLGAGGVKALGIDAPAIAILGIGFPDGDENRSRRHQCQDHSSGAAR